jgi:transcriptional regulator with XRE-family HTH domain
MNKPEWTPALGRLLESLRIQAGMDLATMARRNMLSTLQVKQLEKGGNSGFYNDAIKFSTGQKLLKFFGHELKLETETAIAVPEPAPAPDHSPALAIEAEPLPLPEAKVKPSAVVTESIKPLQIELIEPVDEQPEAATSNVKPYWLGLAFIVIAMLVFGFFQSNDAPNSSLNTSQNIERKVTPAETEKIITPQVDAAAAPQAEPEKSNVSAAVAPEKIEALQFPSGTCQWAAQETELQASAPRKRGEYVHVVALENATVCIKDGDQRVASLSLASGQARSIYGPPPFRVYSPNLSLVKLYFQGEYIKLPSEDIKQIKLSPSALP